MSVVTPTLLAEEFCRVRSQSLALCAPLTPEDMMVQSCPEASPAKWHLAHTTWFFETFILREFRPCLPALPSGFPLALQQLLQLRVRAAGEEAARLLLAAHGGRDSRLPASCGRGDGRLCRRQCPRSRARTHRARPEPRAAAPGTAHHRHQERVLDRSAPSALPAKGEPRIPEAPPIKWVNFPGGVAEIGYQRQRILLRQRNPAPQGLPRSLSPRIAPGHLRRVSALYRGRRVLAIGAVALRGLVDGRRPSAGRRRSTGGPATTAPGKFSRWAVSSTSTTCSPRRSATSATSRPTRMRAGRASVCPPKRSGKSAAAAVPVTGNLLEGETFHPQAAPPASEQPEQLYGDVWEWTVSAYLPYPGFHPLPGALGEYNGKFMCNQMVLRGGSVATPASHIRAPIATFSRPRPAGSSPAFDWPTTDRGGAVSHARSFIYSLSA